MSELLKRVLVAAVGIPIALGIIFAGGWLFAVAIILVSAMSLWEFYTITEKKGIYPFKVYGLITSAVMQFIFVLLLSNTKQFLAFPVLALLLIAFILITVSIGLWSKHHSPISGISATIAGVIYIGIFFLTLICIRDFGFILVNFSEATDKSVYHTSLGILMKDSAQAGLTLGIFVSIWLCDTAAYFFGKKFGKHKMFPRISPKKSWEGAIAGFIFAIAAFIAVAEWLIPGFGLTNAIVCGAIAGTLGQLGDLAESQFKRDAGVKDSSGLLPGHGGAFDRFDSILFTAPAIFIYLCMQLL